MTRALVGSLVFLVALGCGDAAAPGPGSAARSGSAASSSSTGSAPSGSASASAASSASAKPKAVKPDQAMLKHLAKGRELSKAKKYPEAIAEFDKALALTPNDGRVLSEVGWAALQGKDFERSRTASEKALLSTSEPKIRASILYNLGRVAEEEGKKELAAKRYAESLALRDNAEVEKRLVATGGVPPRACSRGFEDEAKLCECLAKRGEWDFLASGNGLSCAKSTEPLDKPRLQLLTLSGKDAFAKQTLIAAKDTEGWRYIGELGLEYNPGAFGIENTTSFDGLDTRKLGERTLATFKHSQEHRDSNMAGLEICFDTTKVHTLCVMSQTGPSSCPLSIPIEVESSCGPGVELDPAETDPVVISMAKSAKDGAFKKSAKVSYEVSDAGEVTVKLDAGDKDLLGKSLVGTHKLF